MLSGMEIDWLGAAEIEELQAFIDDHWRRGHRLAHDAILLGWQHRFPGDSKRLAVLVARGEGVIVGALGVIVVSFGIRGHRSSGAWLTTWIATPAARESQVGLRLLRGVLGEPFDFVGTTGANETALKIYRALGFATCESIPRWVRVISEDALTTLLEGRCSPQRVPPGALPTAASLGISNWSDTHAERWDELWAHRLAPQLIGVWRDAAYLRWRYLEHPRFRYTVRVAKDTDGSLRGLAVHRVANVRGAEGKVARIVELLGDSDAMIALVSDLVTTASHQGVAFAEFYCSAGAVGEPLGACGFTVEPEPTHALPALIEPLNLQLSARLTAAFRVSAQAGAEVGAEQAVFESDALYITRSDCDQDRPQ